MNPASRSGQRGVAVVCALAIAALAATLATTAYTREHAALRRLQLEADLAQARWVARGALEAARVLLAVDRSGGPADHLGEAWAVPLQSTPLPGFEGERTTVRGAIEDAQARFNLANLLRREGPDGADIAALRRLVAGAGEPPEYAQALTDRLLLSQRPGDMGARNLAELLSGDPRALRALRTMLVLLPESTPVNANTAPAAVLAARIDGLGAADAEFLVRQRETAWFRDPADALARLPGRALSAPASALSASSRYFLVRGEVRHGNATLSLEALLRRDAGGLPEIVWVEES